MTAKGVVVGSSEKHLMEEKSPPYSLFDFNNMPPGFI